ncbi:hypothetical protein K491DRAFT_455725 [Lophiostoma macrostomum CBS 122681]|uniref:Uncharacterized protein n=1 Tax=Lophiostoma macrostomum CBS 122681 TaxID=1314788 RepID=A0A6A6T530_9PLEO|nr:hypothetical protein K491DRAFT_455725 [Lophiostoma macrostomum CBS 122681]
MTAPVCIWAVRYSRVILYARSGSASSLSLHGIHHQGGTGLHGGERHAELTEPTEPWHRTVRTSPAMFHWAPAAASPKIFGKSWGTACVYAAPRSSIENLHRHSLKGWGCYSECRRTSLSPASRPFMLGVPVLRCALGLRMCGIDRLSTGPRP